MLVIQIRIIYNVYARRESKWTLWIMRVIIKAKDHQERYHSVNDMIPRTDMGNSLIRTEWPAESCLEGPAVDVTAWSDTEDVDVEVIDVWIA